MQRPYLAPMPRRSAKLQPQRLRLGSLVLWGGLGVTLLAVMSMAALLLGLTIVLSGERVLPAVTVGGVPVGGMSQAEAAESLRAAWRVIALRDGERTWSVPAEELGIRLDAEASAQRAWRYGRDDGSVVRALFGTVVLQPVFQIDASRAAQGLAQLAPLVDLPPRDATIRAEGNALIAIPPVFGRALQLGETLSRLAEPNELADGYLDLVMAAVPPTLTDAAPLLDRAAALLGAPLRLKLYNPVSDQTLSWDIPPEAWLSWLTTQNTEQGVVFSLAQAPLEAYLSERNATLGDAQYIKVPEAASALRAALEQGRTEAEARLYNAPTQYVVRAGDTLERIAWRHGIQMFRIQRANPTLNLNALSVGQVIALPSKDELLPLPIVPNKRIVISIARQRMWVYENRQLKWEWAVSTGIPSSPTQHGVYQVLSHERTAYASIWNLSMPYFLSIYEAAPGFYNGIHGFPSRGGTQVLWQNALGRPVTYGCILLSTANAQALYAWAEDGVVVEIQP